MNTILLLNVGNRDLKVDGKFPSVPRSEGQKYWETYTEHAFDLPIIVPCVRHCLLGEVNRIDRLVLYATDQAPGGAADQVDNRGVRLRDKDTVWYGKIIERWIREHFREQQVMQIERIVISDINPSMYDEAFDVYARLVAAQYDPTVDRCYVLMTGGIPACNSALHLHAISAFGERCHTIYLPEGSDPIELRVGDQVLATFRRATLLDALGRLDFATALAIAPGVAGRAVVELIRYAAYREAFDFERARTALADAIRAASGDLRAFVTELRHDLDDLLDREDTAALLCELLANARMTYQNRRYADFLGRAFRFQEAVLRHIVETHLKLPTDMRREKYATNHVAYVSGIEANPHLKAFLDARTVNNMPLQYHMPNIEVMQAMLSYLLDPGLRADGSLYLSPADKGKLGKVREIVNKVASLAQLRNQSIIAHGFQGVSAEDLAQHYSDDPIKDMEKVVQILGIDTGVRPFERIADQAAEQIRRGTR